MADVGGSLDGGDDEEAFSLVKASVPSPSVSECSSNGGSVGSTGMPSLASWVSCEIFCGPNSHSIAAADALKAAGGAAGRAVAVALISSMIVNPILAISSMALFRASAMS